MSFLRVLAAEFRKLKRCAIVPASILISIAIAAMLAFMAWIMLNPGMASSVGLLGQKATMALGGAQVDWTAYLLLLKEMTGVGGFFIATLLVSWIYGREYTQGTAKIMLTLPLWRGLFPLAKALLSALWLAGLYLLNIVLAIVLGHAVGLGPAPADLLSDFLSSLPALLAAAWACSLMAGWVALLTRGVFAPLGYGVGSLLLAIFLSSTGWGPFVPWSIVAIVSGAGGAGIELHAASPWIITVFALLALFLMVQHQTRADNTQ